MEKDMKKVSLVLLIAILIFSLFSCSGGPADEVLLARFSELIPASLEINDIFFGEGLPTYSRDEYKEAYEMTEGSDPDYDFVTTEAKYQSISEIKEAAESVYTAGYLSSIYTLLFEGFYDNGIGHIAALYIEDSNGFSKHNKTEPTITEARVYELDSAVVLMKNDTYATIEVDTTLAGKSEKVRIRMMNQDGTWLLDDPTY